MYQVTNYGLCGECKHHKAVKKRNALNGTMMLKGFLCDCEASDRCGEYTEYHDTCDEWTERSRR